MGALCGKLLLVEGNPDVASTLAEGIERFSAMTVTWVGSGGHALRALDSHPMALAVVDTGLPDMSGFELVRQLIDRRLPTLLTSGDLDDQQLCRVCNFPSLNKPFLPSRLAAMITHVINNTAENLARVQRSYAQLRLTARRTLFLQQQADVIIGESRHLREVTESLRASSMASRLRLPPI